MKYSKKQRHKIYTGVFNSIVKKMPSERVFLCNEISLICNGEDGDDIDLVDFPEFALFKPSDIEKEDCSAAWFHNSLIVCYDIDAYYDRLNCIIFCMEMTR